MGNTNDSISSPPMDSGTSSISSIHSIKIDPKQSDTNKNKRSSIHSYNRFKKSSSIRLSQKDDLLLKRSDKDTSTKVECKVATATPLALENDDPDYLNIYSSSGKQAGRYLSQTNDVMFVSHLTKTLHRSDNDLVGPPTSPLMKTGTTVRASITRCRSNSKHASQEFHMKLSGTGSGSADSNLSTVFTADITSVSERDRGSPPSSPGLDYSGKSTVDLDVSVIVDALNISCSSIPVETPSKAEDIVTTTEKYQSQSTIANLTESAIDKIEPHSDSACEESVLSAQSRTRARSSVHRHRASTVSTEHRDSIIIEQSLSEKLALSSHEPYTISPVASQDRIVVIDQGSSNMRVGFADADAPSAVFPSVVASHLSASETSEQRSYFVGKPATQKPNRRLSYNTGRVLNWEDMEAIWEHSFSNCLKVETNTAKVFLTEAANTQKSTRERMVETMFELFDVESTYLHLQPILALFASGTTTGCVVDSGEHVTTVCPIAEGYLIPHACQRLPYGGAHITELLTRSLIEKGYGPRFSEPTSMHHLPTEKKLGIVRHIKEECAYVQASVQSTRNSILVKQSDFSQEFGSNLVTTHMLPDGTSVTLDDELYSCTDRMFQPYGFSQILSCETADITIHQTILKSIMKCSVDVRKSLIGNIVLAGGNCSFRGFSARLRNELKAHSPNKMLASAVGINPLTTPGNAVWLGGSIVCSLSTFEERWITAEDYDEVGPAIVHSKCPALSLF